MSDQPVNQPTVKSRFHRLFAFAAVMTLTLATACGNQDALADAEEAPENGATSENEESADNGEDGEGTDSETYTVIDELDREIEIEGPVESAVVLNSYNVEFVNALGKLDTIIGTDASVAPRWPSFGLDGDSVIAQNFDEIDYETVVTLDPDVFILPRNSEYESTAETLEPFGIPVVVVTGWDSTLFSHSIEVLGQIFGEQDRGEELITFHDGIYELLDERLADVDPVSVYFENNDDYVTFLEGSGYHEALEAAGGQNIFAGEQNTGGGFPTATVDGVEILDRQPEALILQYTDNYIEPTVAEENPDEDVAARYRDRDELTLSPAATNGEVYVVNGTPFNFAAKSLWAIYIASWLHPEELADIDPQEYLTEWTEGFSDTEIAPGEDFWLTTDLQPSN